MRKLVLLLLVLLIIDGGFQLWMLFQWKAASDRAVNLELSMVTAEHNAADDAIDHAVYDPTGLYSMIPDSAVWQEVEAVPYSLCYRHLIATNTADFIFCKAK